MKYVILVGDGMGDLPLAELDGRTPLEAARTPAMDFLASHGELGRVKTIPAGFPPGSDVANLSLLGYLPQECYTGRAPLEAASMGVDLAANQVAFRCNLVTLDFQADGDVAMIDYSASHISTPEARILIESLDAALGNERICFYPGISYRHLMVHNGVLDTLKTVAPHDYIGNSVTEYWQRYQHIPHIKSLLAEACAILQDHAVNRKRAAEGKNPANAIWLWGEGKSPAMETFEARFGLRGALISAVDLLKGIGVYAGMDIINVEGATGYLDTNYQGKAEAALHALDRHDLVFVHVEAPDEAAHQGLVREKIMAIEDFDGKIVQPVMDGLKKWGDYRLVVAMDHFTPISLRTHTDYPVPFALYDSQETSNPGALGFTEKNAAETGIYMNNGREFINKMISR